MKRTILALLLVLLALPAASKSLVREFSGNGNTTTASFTVESPWLLDWRLDGDYSSLVALDITLVEARSGRHIGRVLHTKRKGNGVKLFRQGGRYQLRISSTLARWRIQFIQRRHRRLPCYGSRRSSCSDGRADRIVHASRLIRTARHSKIH